MPNPFAFLDRNDIAEMANISSEMEYLCYYTEYKKFEDKNTSCANKVRWWERETYKGNRTKHEILYQRECNCISAMLDVWFWLYEVAMPTIGGIGIVCNTVAILILLSR